jgi:hypothetical protein
VGGAAGHGVKQGLHAVHSQVRATDHDQQVSAGSAGGPAGDRRVDQLDLLPSEPFGPLSNGGGANGCTPELAIMRHGRWRSASVMRGYVEEGSIWNDNAAARLGL